MIIPAYIKIIVYIEQIAAYLEQQSHKYLDDNECKYVEKQFEIIHQIPKRLNKNNTVVQQQENTEIESDFFGKLKNDDKEEFADHQISYIVSDENYLNNNLAANDPYAYIFRIHDEYLATENYNYVG